MIVVVVVVVVVQPAEAGISMHNSEAYESKLTVETTNPSVTGVGWCFVCVLLSVSIISRAFKLRVV